MPKFFTAALIALLALLTPIAVFAQTDTSSRIDLTINQGPGFLLPTSPIYFADIFKNNVRLFLVSYDKGLEAKTHLDIAGERIAEIKVMLEHDSMTQAALNLALNSMVDHVDGAKTALKQAKDSGKNVEKLASDLNTTINSQKDSLRILMAKTDSESSLKIKGELAKVTEIDTQVEDEMAAGQMQNERKRELAAAIADEQKDASVASQKAVGLQMQFEKEFPITADASKSAKPVVAGASTENQEKK